MIFENMTLSRTFIYREHDSRELDSCYREPCFRECDFDSLGYWVLDNYLCSRKAGIYREFLIQEIPIRFRRAFPDSDEPLAVSDDFLTTDSTFLTSFFFDQYSNHGFDHKDSRDMVQAVIKMRWVNC